MNIRFSVIFLCCIFLAGNVPNPGFAQDLHLRPGRHNIALEYQGRRRTAAVFIPEKISRPKDGWPLVLMLHGAGGSTRNVIDGTGWAEVGEREGFVAVFPNGTPGNEKSPESFIRNPQTWNSGQQSSLASGERSATTKGVDDVGFLKTLVEWISRHTAIDPKRVYVAGHSNGAAMAYRFAFERPDIVAAVGTMGGHLTPGADSPLASAVSLIAIIGDHDPFTPMEGGRIGIGRRSMDVPPAIDGPRRWAVMLGLPDAPKILRDDPSCKVLAWGPRDDGAGVKTLIVKGHGHGYLWPGARRPPALVMGPTVNSLNATETIWEFFKAHPKP